MSNNNKRSMSSSSSASDGEEGTFVQEFKAKHHPSTIPPMSISPMAAAALENHPSPTRQQKVMSKLKQMGSSSHSPDKNRKSNSSSNDNNSFVVKSSRSMAKNRSYQQSSSSPLSRDSAARPGMDVFQRCSSSPPPPTGTTRSIPVSGRVLGSTSSAPASPPSRVATVTGTILNTLRQTFGAQEYMEAHTNVTDDFPPHRLDASSLDDDEDFYGSDHNRNRTDNRSSNNRSSHSTSSGLGAPPRTRRTRLYFSDPSSTGRLVLFATVMIGFLIATIVLIAGKIRGAVRLSSDDYGADAALANLQLDDENGYGGYCLGASGTTNPIMKLMKSSTVNAAEQAVVASDHPLCSEMGRDILQHLGGNAIDAAVTVALCLGVANPASSGMGGGAFMLIHADPIDESVPKPGMPSFNDARTSKRDNTTMPLNSVNGKITEVIDCRETAPMAATTNMYVDAENEEGRFMPSIIGGLAIAIPGELRGLELAHARHGRLSWSQVLEPVVRLASKGIEINANLAHEIQTIVDFRRKMNWTNDDDGPGDWGLRNLLTRGDTWSKPLRQGELLQNQKLAELLQTVMDRGANALYTGATAEQLASDIETAGGVVFENDLNEYRPTIRDPVFAHNILGHSIVGIPPPSSGGAAIIGAARFLSGYTLPLSSLEDTLTVHRVSEAAKHVFAMRMSLSDPAYNADVVRDAVHDMTTGTYMEELRRNTSDFTTLPLSQYGGDKWSQLEDTDGTANATDASEGDRRNTRIRRRTAAATTTNGNLQEIHMEHSERQQQQRRHRQRRKLLRRFGYLNDHGTSHFSIVDCDGNAVAMTTSVNTVFGSQVVSPSTGILLGNTMDDFANPGAHDFFGLTPSESNFIKPGKKPLSSMSPTMVFRHRSEGEADLQQLGDLALVLGGSGGPKIISAVLQVLINNVLLGMPLFEAVAHPRIHDQLVYHDAAIMTVENAPLLSGDKIVMPQRTKDALTKRNHTLLDVDYMGCVQAISVDLETGFLNAMCDIRKGGKPAGY